MKRTAESLHVTGVEPEAFARLSDWDRRFITEKKNSDGTQLSVGELARRFGMTREVARANVHRIEGILGATVKGPAPRP